MEIQHCLLWASNGSIHAWPLVNVLMNFCSLLQFLVLFYIIFFLFLRFIIFSYLYFFLFFYFLNIEPVRERERKVREAEQAAQMKHREEELNKITSICNEMV